MCMMGRKKHTTMRHREYNFKIHEDESLYCFTAVISEIVKDWICILAGAECVVKL